MTPIRRDLEQARPKGRESGGRDESVEGDPSSPAGPAAQPPFRALGFALSTLGYASARAFREVLAPVSLEPREFALLRAVGFHEGRSQQALSEVLQIPPSRMVALVDELEARGLVERRANPDDRRARALHLTDAGRAKVGQAFELALAHDRRLGSGLSGEEREQLISLLWRVAGNLGVTPGVHPEWKAEDRER